MIKRRGLLFAIKKTLSPLRPFDAFLHVDKQGLFKAIPPLQWIGQVIVGVPFFIFFTLPLILVLMIEIAHFLVIFMINVPNKIIEVYFAAWEKINTFYNKN